MTFRPDFSGYEAMLPFIEEARTSQIPSKDVVESIKENPAMSGVAKFMEKDSEVSVDNLLKIIYDAFSRGLKDEEPTIRPTSRLEQTYDWCSRNWDLVVASVDFLKSTDLETIVKEQCKEYLPESVVFPDLTVHFVFNGCDGRGFKSDYHTLPFLLIFIILCHFPYIIYTVEYLNLAH